ncbi:hypothetical protein SAMD00020551_4773 [Mesobacillus selenatarsenatis SF-1]|uniref:Uncharacterized protein n=1 Tax=Mesobacillus selenatarsenatis (strain DSM 18680 / JCM 14380 / FERM P-15431 / SF-1) TaxID=1321606 RepID=A0A0A8X9C5_MESS1|nr:hypothetical protein SAMD00020551_4773 [Mesobacillus selenatarsenatis SF-1]
MLDPPATGRGVIGGQRLSGLNEALALFVHVITTLREFQLLHNT